MQNKTPKEIKALQKEIQVKFFTPEDMGPRNWGKEILIAHIPGVGTGKILFRKAGMPGDLQAHQIKDEAQYLYSGEMMIEYDAGNGKITKTIVKEGQGWHIPPLAVHRETPITDCVVIEISNPVFNDRINMEKEYGLKILEGGLPTTTIDEIEIR